MRIMIIYLIIIIGTVLNLDFAMADSSDSLKIKVKADVSEKEITQGEPIEIVFSICNEFSDNYVRVSLWNNNVFSQDQLIIKMMSKNGGSSPTPRLLPVYPASQSLILSEMLAPGKCVSVCYPLHLQCSTNITPGQYKIVFEKMFIQGRIYGIDSTENVDIISNPEAIDIKIIEYDESRITSKYENLLVKVNTNECRYIEAWEMMDFKTVCNDMKSLLWACGPKAVNYQLSVLYDENNGFLGWPPVTIYAWDNIARYATQEQVKKLINIIEGGKFIYGKWPTQYYDPGIVWCFHEIAKNGTDENKILAQPIAEKYEDNIGFKSMEYGVSPYGK